MLSTGAENPGTRGGASGAAHNEGERGRGGEGKTRGGARGRGGREAPDQAGAVDYVGEEAGRQAHLVLLDLGA